MTSDNGGGGNLISVFFMTRGEGGLADFCFFMTRGEGGWFGPLNFWQTSCVNIPFTRKPKYLHEQGFFNLNFTQMHIRYAITISMGEKANTVQ